MNPQTVTLALEIGFWSCLVLVAACMVVVILGPGNIDRLVATDLGLVLIAVDLALFSAEEQTPNYMDAALIIAIISFLVTVVVARQLETGRVFR
ncbi:monovalent cation/H+ antiporter complex subunit F [Vulgatibacter sp.]|uniref:monovalent cation/H+ antiporter complex subunit F n=1 Tax=Vulgatibacter sp. TaxID=1971226 RepID=UPI003564967B